MWRRILTALCLALFVGAGLAVAGEKDQDHDRGRDSDHDHDRARAALQRGEVLPLAAILDSLADVIDGDIIATEFDRDDGRWLYEIEYIDSDGRIVELEVDAADGRILEREID